MVVGSMIYKRCVPVRMGVTLLYKPWYMNALIISHQNLTISTKSLQTEQWLMKRYWLLSVIKLGHQTISVQKKTLMLTQCDLIRIYNFQINFCSALSTTARCNLGSLRRVPALLSLWAYNECPCCAPRRCGQEPSAGWRHVGLVYPSRAAGQRGHCH